MAGFDPNEDTLILSEGADFVATFIEVGVTWPADVTCTLSFPTLPGIEPIEAECSQSQTITVNGKDYTGGAATVVIPRTLTGAASIADRTRWRLHLDKGYRYLWFRGPVERED
ncbi:hypothetical protein SEA_CAFASSO_24 [Gordonia phage Cafasso]|uniref:LtfC/p132/Gp6 beta-sandwich domain-containing protein n=1 Tax=Gordonia phage Cafasso TaxID=2851095 RepID=A0AAE7VCP3_9CAUD|nr:hypothetical protein SEA_CAFASSO_24 [Gordonia phage Cafasso]